MKLDNRTLLANTETKALEFAQMHDVAVDEAIRRKQEEKAAIHRQAALFLRTSIPALVKKVFEQNDIIRQARVEGEELRGVNSGLQHQTENVQKGLEKLIANTKTNLDYLRRGRDPASMAAVKAMEDLHKQMLQLRNVVGRK